MTETYEGAGVKVYIHADGKIQIQVADDGTSVQLNALQGGFLQHCLKVHDWLDSGTDYRGPPEREF